MRRSGCNHHPTTGDTLEEFELGLLARSFSCKGGPEFGVLTTGIGVTTLLDSSLRFFCANV